MALKIKKEYVNKTVGDLAFNSIRAAAGLALFGFGTYLTIQANIGVSPWDTFSIGLSKTLGILYGNAAIIISLSLVIIDLLMHERIGIGTLLDAVIVGKTVDLLNWLNVVKPIENIWLSLAVFFLGMFIQAASQYLYMRAGLCCGPRDTLQVGLARRMPKLGVGTVNIFIQAVVLIIGYLLGGPIGIGTVLGALVTGVFQNLIFKFMKFEPRTVIHQSLVGSWKLITGKIKKADEKTEQENNQETEQ